MGPSLKNKLKSIESYIKQLHIHNEKLLKAIQENDEFLVIYYKKETGNFIRECEDIFQSLNRHKTVKEKFTNFLSIKTTLEFNFEKYGK